MLYLTSCESSDTGYRVRLEGDLTPEQYQALIALLPIDYSDLSESSLSTFPLLTLRELDILRLITLNKSTNAQIATALGITTHTVAFHMTRIMTKLNVTSRKQAAEYAREAELFPASDPTPHTP